MFDELNVEEMRFESERLEAHCCGWLDKSANRHFFEQLQDGIPVEAAIWEAEQQFFDEFVDSQPNEGYNAEPEGSYNWYASPMPTWLVLTEQIPADRFDYYVCLIENSPLPEKKKRTLNRELELKIDLYGIRADYVYEQYLRRELKMLTRLETAEHGLLRCCKMLKSAATVEQVLTEVERLLAQCGGTSADDNVSRPHAIFKSPTLPDDLDAFVEQYDRRRPYSYSYERWSCKSYREWISSVTFDY